MSDTNQQGLFGKYLLEKVDGAPLEPDAKYFVIRYDSAAKHGWIGRTALMVYSRLIRSEMPELSAELQQAIAQEELKRPEPPPIADLWHAQNSQSEEGEDV